MNTRLAQIIAASVGADGTPDRSRIFEALTVTPDDPVALIVDGVLQTRAEHEEHRRAFAALLTAERVALAKVLAEYSAAIGKGCEAITTARVAVEQDRHASRLEIRSELEALAKIGRLLSDQGTSMVDLARRVSARALITAFAIGGVAGLVGSAVTYWLYLK